MRYLSLDYYSYMKCEELPGQTPMHRFTTRMINKLYQISPFSHLASLFWSRLHQELQSILNRNPTPPLPNNRMSNRISPIREPNLFLLHRTPPPRFPSRDISIRPHALNNLVLLRSREDFGDLGKEPVNFIW